MKLLEKILVPIDLNITNEKVIEQALLVAKNYDSEIMLITVLPDEVHNKLIEKSIKKYALDELNSIRETLKKEGINTSNPIIHYGPVFDNILSISRTEDANFILISANSFDEDVDVKLSSLVEKLVRNSAVPVWAVKNDGECGIKNILCPVDFSKASTRALTNAILLARKFGSNLTILSVYEPLSQIVYKLRDQIDEINNIHQKDHTKQLDEFLKQFYLVDLKYTQKVISGKPAASIIQHLKQNQADLVIMGTTGKNNLGRILIGSVTEKVIREVPCSFITTKSSNIIKLRLENEVKDIEEHLTNAKKLESNGLFKEAINQYEICLKINYMHIPSYVNLAKLYEKIGEKDKAEYSKKMASQLVGKLWDKKIEHEIRKHYLK